MKIVHYSLGLPPYRSGGLVKYCMDLMYIQKKAGHEVALLWPGRIYDFSCSLSIKKEKKYVHDDGSLIENFELINPLPIPLLNGIKNIKEYTQLKDRTVLSAFLESEKPDAVHIHTLMGLPIEFIKECKNRGIQTVFTSHDYFGVCPKGSLQKEIGPCIEDHDCIDCILCNKQALSLRKVKFLQSVFYRKLKDFPLMKLARNFYKQHKSIHDESKQNLCDLYTKSEAQNIAFSYRILRKYYIEMLNSIDCYHFNSTNTMNIYSRFIDADGKGKVINITHNNIKDHRKYRKTDKIVRFGYLGPLNTHKGFFYLLDVCDKLAKQYNFELHIFSSCNERGSYLKIHSQYKYSELDQVMDCFDVLIAPSLWNETFGFTVLEAMSFGIPSVVTENVGSKDLIKDGKNGWIVKLMEKNLYNILAELIEYPDKISKMNRWIIKNIDIETLETHEKKIKELYY